MRSDHRHTTKQRYGVLKVSKNTDVPLLEIEDNDRSTDTWRPRWRPPQHTPRWRGSRSLSSWLWWSSLCGTEHPQQQQDPHTAGDRASVASIRCSWWEMLILRNVVFVLNFQKVIRREIIYIKFIHWCTMAANLRGWNVTDFICDCVRTSFCGWVRISLSVTDCDSGWSVDPRFSRRRQR